MDLMIESPELARQGAVLFAGLVQPANSYHVLLAPPPGADVTEPPCPPRLVWRTLEKGLQVEYGHDPARNFWQRLKVKLLSLLPLDSQM